MEVKYNLNECNYNKLKNVVFEKLEIEVYVNLDRVN